jgi:hypothetical protein
MEQGRTGIAPLCNDYGGNRHANLGELDSSLKQLDAYNRRFRDHQWARCAGRLAEGNLQSLLSPSARAHGSGFVPCDRTVRRGIWRLASIAAGRHADSSYYVFDGNVDGARGHSTADSYRRCAWPQYTQISAGEDRRRRRALGKQAGSERSTDLFRVARHDSRNDPVRRRDPLSRQPYPDS